MDDNEKIGIRLARIKEESIKRQEMMFENSLVNLIRNPIIIKKMEMTAINGEDSVTINKGIMDNEHVFKQPKIFNEVPILDKVGEECGFKELKLEIEKLIIKW